MIKKRDIVKISTGGYGIIIDIQYEFNRYQLLGVSNWQLGIENIEKMYTESLVATLNEQATLIDKQSADIERLIDGMKRISECGTTGEDAREMHWIAKEFI